DIATVPTVAAAVRAHPPTNASLLLQGCDADSLAAPAAPLPDAPAYWTVDPQLDASGTPVPYPHGLIEDARRRGFPGLALQYDAVDDAFLAAARAADVIVDVWTINDGPGLTAWTGKDVRWIETDRPDLAPAGS